MMMLRTPLLCAAALIFAGPGGAAAGSSNEVVAGAARFTVLTDSLIRLETTPFNNIPSLIFQTRE